jgi:glycosyltransferase involved in cell wall biosynthesis
VAGTPSRRPAGTTRPAGARVAVVMSGFPRLSQASALGELQALHRAGRLAGIFATGPGDPGPQQPLVGDLLPHLRLLPAVPVADQARALVARVTSLAPAGLQVDALHGYFAHGPAAVAERAADLLGLPFSFGVHGDDARRVPAGELARRVDRSAGVVACNSDVAASVPGSPGKVVELPHGVDVTRFRPRPVHAVADAGDGCGPDGALGRPMRILAVGRFVEKKGFGVLLEAVARLTHPWRLRIVGDGPLRPALEDSVRRNGLGSRVELVGRVAHDRLPEHYAWSDVVAVPSVVDQTGGRDGLPNVVLEAMASGVPVVGTDAGATGPALRASGGGLVLPAGDPRPLATVLDSLARSTAVRRALGAQGRTHAVAHHSLEACSARFVAHLADLHAHGPLRHRSRTGNGSDPGRPVCGNGA